MYRRGGATVELLGIWEYISSLYALKEAKRSPIQRRAMIISRNIERIEKKVYLED
jgi:hypothetical protein